MSIVKISLLRQDARIPCPFGLPINSACKTIGSEIYRLVPLEHVNSEERAKYTDANRKVYLHHRTGERCPFADKIVEQAAIVNCDFGDGGAGERDFPLTPSPYYTRVFNGLGNNSGGPTDGLSSMPLNSYWQNVETQQLFTSMQTMFASQEVDILKDG